MTWHRLDDPNNPPPKDGTRILVWVDGRHDIAFYARSFLDGPMWMLRRDGFASDRWSRQATHWMPLPAPPTDEVQG